MRSAPPVCKVECSDAFCSGLNSIPGFRCAIPGGAFYAFANVKDTGIPSKELADRLLTEAGVACLNGGAFGDFGDGYIRFSYANSMENIAEALKRIGNWVEAQKGRAVPLE